MCHILHTFLQLHSILTRGPLPCSRTLSPILCPACGQQGDLTGARQESTQRHAHHKISRSCQAGCRKACSLARIGFRCVPEPVIRTADIVVMMEPGELDCLVLPKRVAPGLLELVKAPGAVASASGHRIQSLKNASASREDGYWRIDMFVDGFSTGLPPAAFAISSSGAHGVVSLR